MKNTSLLYQNILLLIEKDFSLRSK